MVTAMTVNDLLNDPVFIICAPVRMIVIVVLVVLFGGGDIDL